MLNPLPSMKYKGEREYLHGTDLYQAILAFFLKKEEGGYIKKLAFRDFARNQCDISLHRTIEDKKLICHGIWAMPNSQNIAFYVYESGRSVFDRYPYNEDDVCSGFQIEPNIIKNLYQSQYTLMENIIALTKLWHYRTFPLASGKWVFGQLSSTSKIFNEGKEIKILNKQNIPNKFTRNEVFIDNENVGEVRFIVSEK